MKTIKSLIKYLVDSTSAYDRACEQGYTECKESSQRTIDHLNRTIDARQKTIEELEAKIVDLKTAKEYAIDFNTLQQAFSVERHPDGPTLIGYFNPKGEVCEWFLPTTQEQHADVVNMFKAAKGIV